MKVPRDRGCCSAAALDQGNARETPPRLERAEMSRPGDIRVERAEDHDALQPTP